MKDITIYSTSSDTYTTFSRKKMKRIMRRIQLQSYVWTLRERIRRYLWKKNLRKSAENGEFVFLPPYLMEDEKKGWKVIG